VLLSLVAMGASFMVSYTRARAEGIGVTATVGLAPRMERLVLLVLGILLAGMGLEIGLIGAISVIAALSVATTIQRIWHVHRLSTAGPGPATDDTTRENA
jgi:CDP-diacylglycerol--glycerol-3-phosphate 3-phosphatidyltransferase